MKWQTGQSGNPGGRKPGTGKIDQLLAYPTLLAILLAIKNKGLPVFW